MTSYFDVLLKKHNINDSYDISVLAHSLLQPKSQKVAFKVVKSIDNIFLLPTFNFNPSHKL